jgi:PIN domain nuclease of toxin-antitoxin system
MKLLLNTHLLLWAAGAPERLPGAARELIEDASNHLLFSIASMLEVAIKSNLGRAGFRADAWLLRRGLMDNGYDELSITGEHAIAIAALPPIHKTPLIAFLSPSLR